jgi:hypothetical protein
LSFKVSETFETSDSNCTALWNNDGDDDDDDDDNNNE